MGAWTLSDSGVHEPRASCSSILSAHWWWAQPVGCALPRFSSVVYFPSVQEVGRHHAPNLQSSASNTRSTCYPSLLGDKIFNQGWYQSPGGTWKWLGHFCCHDDPGWCCHFVLSGRHGCKHLAILSTIELSHANCLEHPTWEPPCTNGEGLIVGL